MFALYGLSVAHTNDQIREGQVLEATRGLLLIYGIGAFCGPLLGGIAMETVERTHTQTGLSDTVRILDKVYEIGRACSETFHEIKDQFIRHDPVRGQLNYMVDVSGFA